MPLTAVTCRGYTGSSATKPFRSISSKNATTKPGLLAKHLGFNKEPLRQVEAFASPKLFPAVKLAAPSPDNPRLGVTLTNRGGGIGRIVVKINGKELTADARPRLRSRRQDAAS